MTRATSGHTLTTATREGSAGPGGLTVPRLFSGALRALPVLVLVGFALGPFALIAALIVACVAPPLLLAGAIWLWATGH